MSKTHVIATIEESQSGRYRMAVQGPNGLGLALISESQNVDTVISEAEQHLRDLGWQITKEGFTHGHN